MAMIDDTRLHVGDIGGVIQLTSAADLSTATLLQIKYRKPSGATGVWTGVPVGTNDVKYTTAAVGDLDEKGDWGFQGYAETPSWKGHSTEVFEKIGGVIPVAAP